MKYRAIISIDWGKPHKTNKQEELISALIDAGWYLAETTALTIETEDLGIVWRGVDLAARASTAGGTMTAFTFDFVGSSDFSKTREYKAKKNHKQALAKVLAYPFPTPKDSANLK
jgi:hypothetical protein